MVCRSRCYAARANPLPPSSTPSPHLLGYVPLLGEPLLVGVTVVVLSGLAPMALPLGMRSLAITEGLWLYGGLIVYGGRVLYE